MSSFKNYVYNKTTKRHEFDIVDVDLSIVNGIRRVILADIPTVGFMGENDVSVVINKNTGPLHNEFMIHRIGMIPVHFSEEKLEAFNEDEYVFTCSVKNATQVVRNVTTADIVGTRLGEPISPKELNQLFPKNDITGSHILITRLRPNEELDFSAMLVKSTAKVHSSFSPVSLCAFYFNQDESAKKIDNLLDKERAYIKNTVGDPTSIHFMIELETSLSYKYVVQKAFEILMKKVHTIGQELGANVSDKVTLMKHESIDNTYDLNIMEEDDTLGNLFQSIIYSRFIRNKEKLLNKYTIKYIGYYAPHPLEKKIVIRMTLEAQAEENDFRTAMKECCKIVEKTVEDVRIDWTNFQ